MEAVLFFYKTVEIILGIWCMTYHVIGILNDSQPLPHELIFCGTYFGFTIIAIFGNIGLNMGSKPNMIIEAGVSLTAFFLFIICSILSMYHAENDFHLMYLSDSEESNHPFFAISKKQSAISLFTGLFYLLHGLFSLDAILISEDLEWENYKDNDVVIKADFGCYQPIKVYIFTKGFHEWITKKEWFISLTGADVRDTREKAIQKMFKDLKYVRHENII